ACRLPLRGDARVVAQFKRVEDPREVTVSVQGEGTVVSNPAGITCRADERCRATFTRTRTVQLTAAAAPGHRFADWSGDCVGLRCKIRGVGGDAAVRARFVVDPSAVTLNVDVGGAGLGRVASRPSGIDCGQLCSAGFRRGSRVVLVAIEQRGSRFSGWSGPACASARGDRTCSVTLDRSAVVVARFERSGGGAGTDTSSGPGPQTQAPSVRITSPSDGSSSKAGERIRYAAEISDPQGADLSSYDVVWREDGIEFARGQTATHVARSPGTHTIEVTAVNDENQPATDHITIRIDAPLNRPPSVVITQPTNTEIAADQFDGRPYALVRFVAKASDPDDDRLTFTWTDDSAAPAESSQEQSPQMRLYVADNSGDSCIRTTSHELKLTVSDGAVRVTRSMKVSVSVYHDYCSGLLK
ncbi:MAG: InlB B-repeat-containing protein, partial [Solirubrobacteraceae bacterium]